MSLFNLPSMSEIYTQDNSWDYDSGVDWNAPVEDVYTDFPADSGGFDFGDYSNPNYWDYDSGIDWNAPVNEDVYTSFPTVATQPKPSAQDQVLEGIGNLAGTFLGNWISGKAGETFGGTPMSFGEGRRLAQVEEAKKQIHSLIGNIKQQTQEWRDRGERTIADVPKTVTGVGIPEYMGREAQRFAATTKRERDYGTNFLTNYEPNYMGSQTYRNFSDIVNRSVSDYLSNVARIGERGSQRFGSATDQGGQRFDSATDQGSRRFNRAANQGTARFHQAADRGSQRFRTATETPVAAFAAISENPNFNNLRNPSAMNLAQNPSTVRGSIDQYKQYWNF